jgi:tetratricopeptide (TPR) repeat protein
MYTCPACGSDKVSGMAACTCGADLAMLQCLDAAIDGWFNRALAALAEGRQGEALECFAACCAARPTDAVAQRALAKMWARLGFWSDGGRVLDRAAELEPDHPELALLRSALHEATAPRPVATSGGGQRARGRKRRKRR